MYPQIQWQTSQTGPKIIWGGSNVSLNVCSVCSAPFHSCLHLYPSVFVVLSKEHVRVSAPTFDSRFVAVDSCSLIHQEGLEPGRSSGKTSSYPIHVDQIFSAASLSRKLQLEASDWWTVSSIYCSLRCCLRLWWRFLMHITVEFHGGKEFQPTEACCGQDLVKNQHATDIMTPDCSCGITQGPGRCSSPICPETATLQPCF